MKPLGAALLGLSLLAGGCVSAPPNVSERHLLQNLELPRGVGRLYYRDLTLAEAQELAPAIASVHSTVVDSLGFDPPWTELVVYAEGPNLDSVRETRCELVRGEAGWEIVFAYPYADARRAELLGTTGHEMAEATVLLRVTVIDPYLRWVQDGIGDFAEHQVLVRTNPKKALETLTRARLLVEEHLGRGERWIDLSRWRQLANWIVRSHRLLGPGEANLSLEELEASIERVAFARKRARDPLRSAGLVELETLLQVAKEIRGRGFAPGEAHGENRSGGDLLGYALSFSYWLEVERRTPGAIRAFLCALEKRREEGDHVLRGEEAIGILEEVLGSPPPPVSRYPLERALSVLGSEEARLRR